MDSYRQEVTVGVLVIAGLAAFTAGMFWLTGRSITKHGIAVPFAFVDVAGLKEGDPVRVSGVTKGRVSRVHLERVGHVVVTLALEPEMSPHSDAVAVVASADFLGAKFVDYNPGSKPEMWPGGRPLPGSAEADVSTIAAKTAASARDLLENLNHGLNARQLSADVHNTLIVTQRGMNALADAANGPMVQQATKTLHAVAGMMARLDSVLGTRDAASSGRRLDSLTANITQLSGHLSQATSSLTTLLNRMERGEGSLGRMTTDTMLYKNLTSTLAALSELLTDLKERPGRYLTVKVF
jgi:phospholipid/cholesterol/gamma-HCH transport system substrate-binding protein